MADVIPPTLVDQQQLPNVDRRYLARLRQAVSDLNATLANLTSGSVPVARSINTTAPLTGGGDLSADRTLAMPAANAFGAGYLLSSDWNTFNGKQPLIVAGTPLQYRRGDNSWQTLNMAAIPDLPALASGLYTPTLSGGVNVAASSGLFGQYVRVGNIVHFAVQVSVTPTAASTLTSFLLTLPVASMLAANSDLIGDGSAAGATVVPCLVRGDTGSHGAFVSFTPSSTAAGGVRVVGSYQVI